MHAGRACIYIHLSNHGIAPGRRVMSSVAVGSARRKAWGRRLLLSERPCR
jgi:hypothetical protein